MKLSIRAGILDGHGCCVCHHLGECQCLLGSSMSLAQNRKHASILLWGWGTHKLMYATVLISLDCYNRLLQNGQLKTLYSAPCYFWSLEIWTQAGQCFLASDRASLYLYGPEPHPSSLTPMSVLTFVFPAMQLFARALVTRVRIHSTLVKFHLTPHPNYTCKTLFPDKAADTRGQDSQRV